MLQEILNEIIDSIINDDMVISFVKLLIAMILGLLIGAEREFHGKDAGIKTHALVTMGSTLFIIISLLIIESYKGETMFDPLRVASHIIVGIGFIGGGTIFLKNKNHVEGLSTASNLWICAGIGIACGYGMYGLAIMTTLFSLFIFVGLNLINKILKWIKKKKLKK